ncbi:hypothetical protein N7448_009917 [Penicillium atrosanguineum]|uniref:Enoyl reductase (ER) domain-containing protein n=1 Tax=Penicillium atrosanguineum TaxID=1132637 RepID=A0A9W9PL13_9EURO|nr:uncharacterized protein N7443_007133 [Penicillium atrosanguineum]KAJ5118203.1 hypothetical protein N7526_009840 [Penicillium atrosanguineum]KAJ5119248.1 hypothetical protein N7448_009917 [Penicillium atrosanguineum]KAJ5296240.1 hypothetical protein N7443_007133 [Penicillium atrosanguineum]KAJ5299011.1 hypothetical protein N7476_010568 [Penicillium atrosanguineum]
MAEIPVRQKAVMIQDPGPNGHIIFKNCVPVERPGENEVLVKLECSGIWYDCTFLLSGIIVTARSHSDLRGLMGWGTTSPIPGHEGVGWVIALGPSAPSTLLGQRVGIRWLHSACGVCSVCSSIPAFPNNCPQQRNTGRNVPGTLEQYMVAHAFYLSHIPDGLPSEVAAPLLCAGLSMAGAISRLEPELERGNWVIIPGAGGGLGHLGLQIAARTKGYRVVAVDTGEAKRELCLSLGAEAFVDFLTEDIEMKVKELTDGEFAHGIVVVPGGQKAYTLAPKLIRNRGVMVCVGLPREDFHIPISPIECCDRGLVIKGSATGNEEQMQELFQLALSNTVLPQVELIDFSRTGEILEKLRNDEISGRVVTLIPP